MPRGEAYQCDVIYGTNNEFGFDYLRDNMASTLSSRVQRERHFAIIDEADSVLIDEARTPLIISGAAEQDVSIYPRFARLVPSLREDHHYTVDLKTRSVALTEDGVDALERGLGVDNIYSLENFRLTRYMEAALKAEIVYERDRDYIVKDGEVVIVDDFTGRLMEGRRWSDGLHQAVEAKESVQIQRESVTYATITLQNFFRLYDKLSGMTGTAVTEAEELNEIYKLEVVIVPTHRSIVREDNADLVYRTLDGKWRAVVEDIIEKHEAGRPVLVGTVAIETSEMLADRLTRRGVPHEVLNAKQHQREAQIISRAGRPGAVTIATNMAGRGTDIKLGDGVADAGGLHVLGTERHESRRIDNQLRGRSGRQGRPGFDALLRIVRGRDPASLRARLAGRHAGEDRHGRRDADRVGDGDALDRAGSATGRGLQLRYPQARRGVRRRHEFAARTASTPTATRCSPARTSRRSSSTSLTARWRCWRRSTWTRSRPTPVSSAPARDDRAPGTGRAAPGRAARRRHRRTCDRAARRAVCGP